MTTDEPEQTFAYLARRIPEGGWRVIHQMPDGSEVHIQDYESREDAIAWIHTKLGIGS